MKIVPESPIENNNSALLKKMAWHQPVGKQLSEPMIT